MKKQFYISILLILIFYLPVFIIGENSFITIHDNLDSEFIYLHLLKVNHSLFPFSETEIIPNIMNGLNRDYFHSEFSLVRVFFQFLPSFWAYIFNSIFIRIIGIVGMFLLVKDYFNFEKQPSYIVLPIAVSFAMLPVYSLYGLSVLGQPLLLWAFLNLKNSKKLAVSFTAIVIFPFYAHLAMTAPFILSALFLFGIYLLINRQNLSPVFWWGIAMLLFSYLGANFTTLSNFIFNDIPSHRVEWQHTAPELLKVIDSIFFTITNGHYHSSRIFSIPALMLAVYALWLNRVHFAALKPIIYVILVVSVWYSVYRLLTATVIGDWFPILVSFQFNRFTFLLPFLFYLIFLVYYSSAITKNKLAITLLFIFAVVNISKNEEFTHSWHYMFFPKKSIPEAENFKGFYSENLFNEVEKYIHKDQEDYKVVCLGFHPAIAQYNGFYTLDSYQNNYPLSYKQQFYEIIAPELDKSPDLKRQFENWGSRCYIFSSELKNSCSFYCSKYDDKEIDDLNINTVKIKEMEGKYLLSSVKINNFESLNLNFKSVFENSHSNLKIYLYEL